MDADVERLVNVFSLYPVGSSEEPQCLFNVGSQFNEVDFSAETHFAVFQFDLI